MKFQLIIVGVFILLAQQPLLCRGKRHTNSILDSYVHKHSMFGLCTSSLGDVCLQMYEGSWFWCSVLSNLLLTFSASFVWCCGV